MATGLACCAGCAGAIRPGAPLPRLSDGALPAELVPLVTAFDDAAARLDGALAGQRRFTANAAHELRTPLPPTRACPKPPCNAAMCGATRPCRSWPISAYSW
jgi:hypothetical protein